MNDGQLRRLLAEQSPWRAHDRWEQSDPDIHAATRLPLAYEPDVLADIRPPGLYVLRGPRRVGKSLAVKRTIARLLRSGVEARTVFYCSCDGLSAHDLRRLVAAGHSATRTLDGPRYWFLDEITAVRGWSAVVKHLRDQNATFRQSCVVLTGSSARDLREATKDLADRRGGVADSDRLLLPMGFRSFCRALPDFGETPATRIRPSDFLTPTAERAVDALEPWTSALDDAWQLYLTVGGFPRAVGEFVQHGAVERGFVDGLWDVIVGDAIRTNSMSDVDVTSLLVRLVANLGSPLNATAVAKDVGLRDGDRVNERVEDLVCAFLAWRCHRLKDGLPSSAAQRKVYFVDPLVAQLPHLRNERAPAPDLSLLNEQQIGLHISRALSLDRPTTFVEADGVMYERTGTGAEIDFVGPQLGVPVECKYQDTPWKQATLTMRARYGRGVLVTRTPLAYDDDVVWAVPAGAFAWLIDAYPGC